MRRERALQSVAGMPIAISRDGAGYDAVVRQDCSMVSAGGWLHDAMILPGRQYNRIFECSA